MTINCQFATVADSIAGLTISGVTIKDIDQIPVSASLTCPILFPQPEGFISDIQYARQSFGSNGTPKIDFSYTLNYVYLHCETGSGISALDPYAGIIAKLELITETIMSNDAITGAVDIIPNTIGGIGSIQDPAGNTYWGALLSFRVLEFAQ